MVGAMPVGLSYLGAATVDRLHGSNGLGELEQHGNFLYISFIPKTIPTCFPILSPKNIGLGC